MRTSIKPVLLASLLTTVLSVPFAHAAEDAAAAPAAAPASPHTLSTNIGFFTDYTFRGISYTRERGAVQGGIDYSHSSGLYLGVWGTNVHNAALYGNTVEVDVYGGYIRP
ncbi:MAG TPA: TorF family putative porin, partial [Methylotenera sp.]